MQILSQFLVRCFLSASLLGYAVLLSPPTVASNEVYNTLGFSGPGAKSASGILKTVKQAQQGMDEQAVIIRGRIISRISPEHYWFQDSTGKMMVEIDNDAWKFIAKQVNAQTSVQIIGEVDREGANTNIEVKAILP